MPSYIIDWVFNTFSILWSWLNSHYIYYSESLSVTWAGFLIGSVVLAVIYNFLIPWQGQIDDDLGE